MVRSRLQEAFPEAAIFVADREYHYPTKRDIEWLLSDSSFEVYKYLKSVFDCDDYCLMLHAFVRQEQYKEKWEKPWAFGEIWSRTHAYNVVVSEDEILCIEPQTDAIWTVRADPDIWFVRM